MADELMYIPNNYTQNYLFCRSPRLVDMFEHSRANQSKFNESPQVVKQTNKKTLS